jgi:3-oxoacyl-[acyl-carrier-protein] synthase-3
MTSLCLRHAQILSTGRHIPERVVTNDDLNELLGENVGDWLVENVGIRERHVMAEDETTSDMIVAASRLALERAGIAAADLDLIIVATDTPDYISPATASPVQAKLGAFNAGTYDINCACAAWVTGLDLAARHIATDADYRYILVAGGYGMTKFLDSVDPRFRV